MAKKISSILSDEQYLNPPIPIVVIESNGSLDNLNILCNGNYRLAIVQSDILIEILQD